MPEIYLSLYDCIRKAHSSQILEHFLYQVTLNFLSVIVSTVITE